MRCSRGKPRPFIQQHKITQIVSQVVRSIHIPPPNICPIISICLPFNCTRLPHTENRNIRNTELVCTVFMYYPYSNDNDMKMKMKIIVLYTLLRHVLSVSINFLQIALNLIQNHK